MKRKRNIEWSERTRDEQGRFDEEGNRVTDERGYVLILCPDHPHKKHGNYVYEHRLIMEQHLGRYLESSEVLHHINGIPGDNRLENLRLFSSDSKHARAENRGDHFGEEGRRKGIEKSAEIRRKERKLISCACGCGILIEDYDSRGRPRRFVHGHNQRGRAWKWA
jgi:hypothetical protein